MKCACAMFSSVASPVELYFPNYLINSTIFEKKLLNIQCVFWFSLQLFSEIFLIVRTIQGDLLDRFSKNIQISNSTKIRPVEAELFHADGRTDIQTDMMKLIVAFRNFANASKKGLWDRHDVCVCALVYLNAAVPNKRNLRLSLRDPCTQRHSAIFRNAWMFSPNQHCGSKPLRS